MYFFLTLYYEKRKIIINNISQRTFLRKYARGLVKNRVAIV